MPVTSCFRLFLATDHTLQPVYVSFVTLNLQMSLDYLQLTVNLGEHLELQ